MAKRSKWEVLAGGGGRRAAQEGQTGEREEIGVEQFRQACVVAAFVESVRETSCGERSCVAKRRRGSMAR